MSSTGGACGRWRCARLLISNTEMAIQKHEPPPPHTPASTKNASTQAQIAIIQPHVSTRITDPEALS